MDDNRRTDEKQREIILTCLDVFTSKGLINTTSRDLSAALNLQNAGIYYYFKSKDDLVIACAEEATLQLEQVLIPIDDDLDDLDLVTETLRERCDMMAPKMKFLAQTYTVEKYSEKLRPFLNATSKRYKEYAAAFAKRLGIGLEEIEPYIYMAISAATDYMIFGNVTYIKPQFELLKSFILKAMNKD